ncbi:MAG: hypothetical protein A370_02642 [Clostridium sp. Maddingley MBC34-26]|nr:MAG: hypothetical protein A370_02642 [Clostridium sp. Maddingley MBC34-26]
MASKLLVELEEGIIYNSTHFKPGIIITYQYI